MMMKSAKQQSLTSSQSKYSFNSCATSNVQDAIECDNYLDDEEEMNLGSLFDEDDDCKNIGNEEDDKIPDEWNLVTAFDKVLDNAQELYKGLGEIKSAKSALQYIMDRLSMTKVQVLVLAMLIDNGRPMAWGGLSRILRISRLKMMTHTEEIEELIDKRRWLKRTAAREMGNRYEGFALVHGVIKAIRHNEVFEPEKLDGMDEQQFVDRMTAKITAGANNQDNDFADDEQWLMNFVELNKDLPLCKAVMSLDGDIHNKSLFLLLISDYARFAEQSNEGLTMHNIDTFFPEDWECQGLRHELMRGSHELIRKGYVEFKCAEGMADSDCFVITQKTKDELLSSFKPTGLVLKGKKHGQDRDLLRHQDIKEKPLYYNDKEGKQMERLKQMLSQEQLTNIQQRLEEKGMRTGVCVLLSGGPGTGKTESVRQIAKATGRDLLMIDISQVKDKFVGESEKRTKAIFDRYKRLCKDSEVKPILFINECDAILGKRFENAEHSADKMQNSMQNILLQAMEDLDGVMICTTNLASTLDAAFERRFLMKVEFDKPDTTVRSKIWKSMIPSLSESEAHTLAERYAFSGGQVENVMRKSTIDEIINGNEATFAQIDTFCKEETFVQKSQLRPIAGFAA